MAIADPASRSNAGSGLAGPGQPASEHRNALDGLRVFAALAVLAANVGGATGLAFNGSPASWVVTRGDVGVPVFFALSGFLLYRPWAVSVLGRRDAPDARSYLRRRAVRIIPAYWVVVVVALITLNLAHARSAWTWIQYLLLLQSYDPHPWWTGTGALGLGQMWSLAVDALFYALLPVLAAALAAIARRGRPAFDVRARARRLLAGVAVLGLSSYAFLVLAYRSGSGLPWLGVTLPALLTWFAVGMALAVVTAWADAEPQGASQVRAFRATVAASAAPCLLIAGLLFVIACTPVAGPQAFTIPTLWQAEIKTGLYTMIAAAVVAPAVFQSHGRPRRSSPALARTLGSPPMRYLAVITYSVFLWQGVVIAVLAKLTRLHRRLAGESFLTLSTAAFYVVVLAVTCLIATVSYLLIERQARLLARPHVPPEPEPQVLPSAQGQP